MRSHVEARSEAARRFFPVRPTPNSLAHHNALRQALQRAGVQPKLEIGPANDPLEREADRMAEQVMRMPDPRAVPVRAAESGQTPARHGRIGGTEGKNAPVRAKALSGQSPAVSPDLESGLASLQGGGQPLDASTRAFFEPRFGQNFSQVRLHTHGEAADLAQAVQAKAFTLGNHVFFGAGHYQPASSTGQKLLAHELAHVAQQGGRPSSSLIRRDPEVLSSQPPGGWIDESDPSNYTDKEYPLCHEFKPSDYRNKYYLLYRGLDGVKRKFDIHSEEWKIVINNVGSVYSNVEESVKNIIKSQKDYADLIRNIKHGVLTVLAIGVTAFISGLGLLAVPFSSALGKFTKLSPEEIKKLADLAGNISEDLLQALISEDVVPNLTKRLSLHVKNNRKTSQTSTQDIAAALNPDTPQSFQNVLLNSHIKSILFYIRQIDQAINTLYLNEKLMIELEQNNALLNDDVVSVLIKNYDKNKAGVSDLTKSIETHIADYPFDHLAETRNIWNDFATALEIFFWHTWLPTLEWEDIACLDSYFTVPVCYPQLRYEDSLGPALEQRLDDLGISEEAGLKKPLRDMWIWESDVALLVKWARNYKPKPIITLLGL